MTMAVFFQVIGGMTLLGILIYGGARGILAILREHAPHWLTPDGRPPEVEVAPRSTRLVPKGSSPAKTKSRVPGRGNEFAHLPRFARRAPLLGSAPPDRNWIT